MRKEVSKPEDLGVTPEPEENGEECSDGKHCGESEQPEFKEVPESEILGHLREGWVILKELKSGDVIMSKGGS
jgi:hypothetical protein